MVAGPGDRRRDVGPDASLFLRGVRYNALGDPYGDMCALSGRIPPQAPSWALLPLPVPRVGVEGKPGAALGLRNGGLEPRDRQASDATPVGEVALGPKRVTMDRARYDALRRLQLDARQAIDCAPGDDQQKAGDSP